MNQKEQAAFNELSSENAELKNKIANLSSENASAQKISELEASLAEEKSKNHSISEELGSLKSESEKEISDLKKELEEVKSESEKEVSELKSEVEQKDKVIAELSAANEAVLGSDVISISGKNYKCIAKHFYVKNRKYTLEEIIKDEAAAKIALMNNYLVEIN